MLLLRFCSLIAGEYKAAGLGLAASIASTWASIGLMAAAGWFLTAMADAAVIGISINLFVPSALIRLLAILRTGLRYVDRLLSHAAAFRIIEKFRSVLFARALELDFELQLRLQQADLERRLHGDIEKLELAYLRQFMPILCAFVTGLGVGLILASFNLRLCLCFALTYLLAGLIVPWLSSLFFGRISAALAADLQELHSEASIFIGGLLDFMVLNALPGRIERLELLNESICRIRRSLSFIEGINQALLMFLASLCFLGLIACGALFYRGGTVSPAQCMMLAIGALSAFECLQPMSAALLLRPEAENSAQRVFELMDGPRRREGNMSLSAPLQEIVCREVGFAYGGGRAVLSGFSCTFSAGENYAVTGPLGSGKTTVLYLLCGLLHPQQGSVSYDGLAGGDLKSAALNAQFSICFQDPGLMSGSIREIFTAVNPELTDAAIMDLLRVVELAEFTAALPEGLDTYIGEHGRALSGGQARRFALARALGRHSPFLLLDEPGEGLEVAQERRILQRILSQRKGVIMVSHRAAGLDYCDKMIRL